MTILLITHKRKGGLPSSNKQKKDRIRPNSETFFTNQAHYASRDGKSFLVVPGVPVQEQVMNTYLLPAEEIQKSLNSWNNTPVCIRHAQANGGSVQVEKPDVPIIGFFDNATWDAAGKRMLGDYWIDVNEASKHPDGLTIMNSIQQGQIIETSTAYWADEEYKGGLFKGRPYLTIHRNPKRDHIAIFPNDQVGACSVQDGCGMNRNMKQNCGCVEHNSFEGHEGRPGFVGGSRPRGAASSQYEKMREEGRFIESEKQLSNTQISKLNTTRQSVGIGDIVLTDEGQPVSVIGFAGAKATLDPKAPIQGKASSLIVAPIMRSGMPNHKFKFEIPFKNQRIELNVSDYQKGYLPTEMLIGYALNKGSRSKAEMDSMRAYVEKNGITKKVWLKRKSDGSICILDGNHRVSLADEFGIEQIPVRALDENLNPIDPEALYRDWLHEQDQGYLQ